jgi:hypothetical protein
MVIPAVRSEDTAPTSLSSSPPLLYDIVLIMLSMDKSSTCTAAVVNCVDKLAEEERARSTEIRADGSRADSGVALNVRGVCYVHSRKDFSLCASTENPPSSQIPVDTVYLDAQKLVDFIGSVFHD